MRNHIDTRRLAAGLAAFALAALILGTCRNPLTQIGLGDEVDLEPPDLAVTSHQNGEYAHGTELLAGTFADDLGIGGVSLSLDGGATFVAADLDATAWTYSLDTLLYGDGEHELIVRAVDGAGKSLERRLLLYFDNLPPVVLVKVPTGYASGQYNGDFSIKGEAADQFGITEVMVEVWNSLGTTRLLGPVPAAGTSSWSYLFASQAYNADLQFKITATDRSGNANAYLYHYDDVYAANGSQTVTVEQVNTLDQGQTVGGLTLTPAALAFLRKDNLAPFLLTVNQAMDLPDFIISNPDEEAPPEQKVLGSSARAIGMVLDDDGVQMLPPSVWISLDGGGFVPVTQTDGSGLSVRWQHSLSALGGGPHTLQLRAEDIYGIQNDSNVVSFTIDLGAPSVEVTSPAQGSYQKGTFLIQGTAFDSEGVASVKVSTNGGANYYPATNTGTGYSTWEYSAAVPGDGLTDGNRTIKILAEDLSAKQGYFNLQVIVDTQDPSINFLIPATSSSVNGEVLLKGTASDNTQVSKVELKIGKSDPWIQLSGTYNWEYSIDSVSYANATHADETPPGSQVWKLIIQARATDAAGNLTTLSSYYLFIDNNLDKPTVNIVSPANGQNIGGSVLVTGTAFDDDAVHHVEMQLDLNGDGDFLDSIDLNGDLDFLDKFEQEGLWYSVSGTTLWTQELNGSGELYETEPGHYGDITLRVRAVDTKNLVTPDVAGNFQQLAIHFDDTIPRIENLSLDSGDYVKGSFTLTGDALDDTQITGIYISYDGGVNYVNITADPTKVTQNAPDDYDLHILINSAAYIPASGILYLRLKVVDNANYQKINFINLNVDNVFPTGTYSGSAADIYGSATNARLQGTAVDAGAVSGVQAVEVYFVRSGIAHSPRTSATTPAGTFDFGDGSGPGPYVTDSSYRIRIDNRYELGNDGGGNGDGDGFDESFTLAGSTYNWWAEFDSALIPDGLIDIHYVVFDQAGNGRHYLQAGFIKNHKPSITSVDVGSDVDASGVVEVDERFAYTVPIQARSRLYTGINATDNAGGLQYAVYHDPGGANTLVWTDPNASSQTLDISGYAEGATTFRCLVTDADGIQTESTLVVTIANLDTVDPSITINALTQADAAAGHAELEGESLYDGTDPDVSGTITLKGSATDNQRMAGITVKITDSGGPGPVQTVASWVGGTLVSQDANFAINSQSLTESGGHQVTWIYTWNTAGVANSVGKTVAVLFEVTDFATPTARTGNYARGYDVVPYIKKVSTQTGGIKDGNIRSVSGKYSIRQNLVDNTDLITLTGYNLRPIANGVRVSSDPDGLVGTILQGTALTVESSTSPWTTLTLRKNSDRSGYLAVVAGTAGVPVPSLNNVNDNARAYNQEPDVFSQNYLLTDDRYLYLYRVTQTGYANGYYPAMVMNGNTPIFAYTNDTTGAVVRDGTVVSNGWFHRMNALARDSSGNLFQVSVHDAFDSTPNYGHLTLFYNTYGGGSYSYGTSTNNTNNALALDNLSYTAVKLNRYHYPKLIANGNSTTAQVYLAYYDDEPATKDLIVRVFQVGTVVAGGTARNLAAGVVTNQAEAAGNGTAGTAGTENGRNVLAGSASQSFDVGVTSGGVLVAAYYDEAANQLRFTYNTTPVNANGRYGGSFAAPLDLDTTYNGSYVSLHVDSLNHIHIAYYDSAEADLKYVYLDSYTDTTPSIARVDAYHSVGLWTDVRTNAANVPYIAYYNNSENGTRDSLKLARYLGTLPTVSDGVDGSGNVTGAWECLTVPVRDVPQGGLPQFNQANLGFDTSGDPTIGYLADDIEYSNFLPEL